MKNVASRDQINMVNGEQTNNITVCVISGLTLSGKSFLRNWLVAQPEFKDAHQLAMDDIRRQVWKDKDLTCIEHIFKNELTRNALKTKIVIERPRVTILEMVMLTREYHQKPFLEILQSARWYVENIQKEKGENKADIGFRCVLLYCDLETVRRRIQYRLKERDNTTGADVFDLRGYLDDAGEFELPVDYIPLPINTSDESFDSVKRIHEEVISFLRGQMPISDEEFKRRTKEASDILAEAKRYAKEGGIDE